MRVLHLVKTADGASWAADQAAELVKLGVEIHVALPRAHGRAVKKWSDGGAVIHILPTDIPVRTPWGTIAAAKQLAALVGTVKPDLLHSHFFGSTVLLRMALGKKHGIPRIFQVPGPLHLEHRLWRQLELSSAGSNDFWVGSSQCIVRHYRAAGVARNRLYLSYYGLPLSDCQTARTGELRRRYGIPDHFKVIGNANFMYPPKWYLGQSVGLKAHEDVIDALGIVTRQRSDVVGVLIGGSSIASAGYENSLRRRARKVDGDRILLTGYVPVEEIRRMWPDFDIAVHVPTSENCGGVGEPMLAGVPTIAGRVGGLPEVVLDGVTGSLVPIRQPEELARAIIRVLDAPEHSRALAKAGQQLMRRMTSLDRIGHEMLAIYKHILGHVSEPPRFFHPVETLEPAAAGAWEFRDSAF